jgi:hypothetical protein
MWFEPAMAPNFEGIGFETPPGGEIGSSKHLLNEHSYCCGANLDFQNICATGEPDIKFAKTCEHYHKVRLSKFAEDAKRLGVGANLTEFGACLTEEACTHEIN